MLRYPCEPDARLHAVHQRRAESEIELIKKCEICGREFKAQRSTARYCSATCRSRASRGYAYTGELQAPAPSASMTDDEVLEVVQRAHAVASDLSRASMLTAAPLCLRLRRAAKRIEDALRGEEL